MPATQFKCPNGACVDISACLEHCPNGVRCMFLPTLRAIAKSVDRKLTEPTVTELLSGTRESYLKKTINYAITPTNELFALHGTAMHSVNEDNSEGNMLTEVRLYDGVMSGKFDVYGKIIDESSHTLGDYKVTSSYKLMKALGYYKVDVPTGEGFKTGPRKGEPKTRKEWRTDGIKYVFEWSVQVNRYRQLLAAQGFDAKKLYVEAFVRDFSKRNAAEYNIKKPVYIIPINRISDHWLNLYFDTKAKRLKDALEKGVMPPPCSARENWHGRKCQDYCDVVEQCPFGMAIKRANEKNAA